MGSCGCFSEIELCVAFCERGFAGGNFEAEFSGTLGCDRNRMPFLSEVSNIVQNIFCLYDVTGFTQFWHPISVATKCNRGAAKW
jgi:hypothetical protein